MYEENKIPACNRFWQHSAGHAALQNINFLHGFLDFLDNTGFALTLLPLLSCGSSALYEEGFHLQELSVLRVFPSQQYLHSLRVDRNHLVIVALIIRRLFLVN